jgi:hypothetical protein
MPAIKQKLLFGGAVFVLILSVVAFVFIPAFGGGSAGQAITFGAWDGTPIEYKQDSFFLRQIQSISEQMKNQGQELNQFNYYQAMQSAFNASVLRLAMLDELKKAGYSVPASILNKYLVQYYLDENGKYSAKMYANTPELTRATRRATLTEELTAQRYVDDVFGTQDGFFGLKTSTKEVELIKTMLKAEKSFHYAAFDVSSFPDSEVASYGQANSSLFAQHSLSLITLAEEGAAKKLHKSLEKAEITFDDAVAKHSTRNGTDAAGKLTKTLRADVNELFTDAADLDAVLNTAPAAISPVVKAGSSWAIVRCDALPQDPDFSNPAVINAVRSYMNKKERGKIEDWFMAKAKAFTEVARTKGLDAACAEAGLAKKTTAPFTVNYGNVEIMSPVPVDGTPELAAASKDESFFKAAFSLSQGAISDPVLLGNSIVVLQLAEETVADSQIMEMAPLFYNYYASSWAQKSVSNAFMKSDKLQDDFMKTYLQYFLN